MGTGGKVTICDLDRCPCGLVKNCDLFDCAMRAIGMISLFIRGNSGKQPRHLYHGGVENVEKELGDDADGEHEKCDRNYHPLLVRSEIGKSGTSFDEWT